MVPRHRKFGLCLKFMSNDDDPSTAMQRSKKQTCYTPFICGPCASTLKKQGTIETVMRDNMDDDVKRRGKELLLWDDAEKERKRTKNTAKKSKGKK